MTRDQLAVELAARLNAVVPAWATIVADGQEVRCEGRGDTLAVVVWSDAREDLESVAYAVLEQVQDWVTEVTTEPWPVAPLPLPDVALDGDVLRLAYGDVLVLEPIVLG